MSPSSRSTNRQKSVGKYAIAYVVYILFLLWLALGFDHPSDLSYVLACVMIAIASFVLIFNPWNGDLFEPIKLAAIFYGLSFGVGPLVVGPDGIYDIWYLGSQVPGLLRTGAYLCLLGFLLMVAAYYLTPTPRYRSGNSLRAQSRGATRSFLVGGGVVLLAGFASYLVLLKSAGGLGHFLSYTGGRGDIFEDTFGGWYWGTFFLVSGLSVVGAAIVARRPWTVFGLGITLGALLALFQGRAAAVTPVLVSTILIYYGYKRLSLRTLAITAVTLLFFASLLGVYRATDKNIVKKDVAGFVLEFSARAHDNLLVTFNSGIERLDQFLICYRYVEKEGKGLGGTTLLAWLGPVNRHLFGGALQGHTAGPFLFGLVNPHAKGAKTGILPSLPGELYLNFGLWGLILGQLLYGALLKQISAMTRQHPMRPLTLAIYPYLTLITTYLIITGTVQLFYVTTVMVGIFTATLISGLRTDKPVLRSDLENVSVPTRFAQQHKLGKSAKTGSI